MRAGASPDALTREDALSCHGCATWSALFLGRRRIKTAISSFVDLGDAAETDRTCATGAPYYLPFARSVCVPIWGSEVAIEWGNRGGAADDIEDLANQLHCRRAERYIACRDASVRGIGAERRNTECESR